MNKTADRILALRLNNELTHKEVADFLHIGEVSYAEYEVGSRRIEMGYLIMLSNFYDVPLDYILGLTNSTEKKYIMALSSLYDLESIFIPQVK